MSLFPTCCFSIILAWTHFQHTHIKILKSSPTQHSTSDVADGKFPTKTSQGGVPFSANYPMNRIKSSILRALRLLLLKNTWLGLTLWFVLSSKPKNHSLTTRSSYLKLYIIKRKTNIRKRDKMIWKVLKWSLKCYHVMSLNEKSCLDRSSLSGQSWILGSQWGKYSGSGLFSLERFWKLQFCLLSIYFPSPDSRNPWRSFCGQQLLTNWCFFKHIILWLAADVPVSVWRGVINTACVRKSLSAHRSG